LRFGSAGGSAAKFVYPVSDHTGRYQIRESQTLKDLCPEDSGSSYAVFIDVDRRHALEHLKRLNSFSLRLSDFASGRASPSCTPAGTAGSSIPVVPVWFLGSSADDYSGGET
jgi:hypothetical protein